MTRRTRCAASKTTGQIKWQGELVFVSEAVRGETGRRSPKRSAAIGPSASCRWNWAASIARRADLRPRGTAGGSDETRRRRSCGNAAPMEITERFPQELGNLAENARFPHSHKLIVLVGSEGRRQKKNRKRKCYPCIRSVLLPMFPVAHG